MNYREFILEAKRFEKRREARLKALKKTVKNRSTKRGRRLSDRLQLGDVDSYVTAAIPGQGKSTIRKALEITGAVSSELDKAREEGGHPPTYYSRELANQANKGLEGGAERGATGIVSDTNTNKRAQEASRQALRNAGYKNPAIIFPHGSTLRKGLRVGIRRNRNRPINGAPGSSRVPDFVMRNMSRALIQSMGSRRSQRLARRAYTDLHKKVRFTKPNLINKGIIKPE